MKLILSLLIVTTLTLIAEDALTLAWNESPEANVVGYRLYAGTNSGSYFIAQNVVGKSNTTNQMSVPTRTTWFFAVTATNSAGLESPYSSEISFNTAALPRTPSDLHVDP